METLGVILVAALYGVAMKVADLTNEHGLRLFQGDAMLAGCLWAIAGMLLLVTTTEATLSALVAMNVAFIVRGRLDYRNHQLAATAIIALGIVSHRVLDGPFLSFLAIFVIFGCLKDYVDDTLRMKGWLAEISELMLYYPIPAFIYSFVTGDWLLFEVFATYTIAYDAVKAVAKHCGYP